MKRSPILIVVLTSLFACGCASSRITYVPYNSVNVCVESEIKNDDHLTVLVGNIGTNMPTQTALALLSRLYTSRLDDPPPMVLDLETKMATVRDRRGFCFLERMEELSSRYGFELYVLPLPYSSAPAVDGELDRLWEGMTPSNRCVEPNAAAR